MKQLAVIVGVVIVLTALKAAASIVVPLLLAGTIAMAFQPITARLEKRGVPTIVASVLTVLCVLGVLVGLGTLIGMAARDFAKDADSYAAKFDSLRNDVTAWLQSRGMGSVATEMQGGGTPEATPIIRAVLSELSSILGDLFNILILTVFIQLEARLLGKKLELILSDGPVGRTQNALGEAQRYLRVKFLLSTMNGIFLGFWCWMMGVSNPVLWGVIAFAFNFVPIIGSLLAAIPPILLGLVEGGIGTALGVAGGYVMVNVLVDNALEPRLMGRAMNLSPLVIMMSLLVWGFVLGPVGALLSVPLTVAVRIYLDYHPKTRWLALLLAGSTKGYQDLKKQPAKFTDHPGEPPAAAD